MFAATSQIVYFLIIVCSVLILLLSLFVVWFIFQYKQRQNLYFKEMERLKTSHENAILLAQLEMQEQTFQNISREIHDNVGQKLSLAKLQVINAQNNALSDLEKTVDIIGNAISDLRNLSRTLNSDMVLANGLFPAIEFEIEQLKKATSFYISFKIIGERVFMESGKELILFRIIQESLQNIVKHSKASNIQIKLNYRPDSLLVSIQDNGQGFNKNHSKGQGFHNMEARAKNLGGQCIVNTKEGVGTDLEIIIPKDNHATV